MSQFFSSLSPRNRLILAISGLLLVVVVGIGLVTRFLPASKSDTTQQTSTAPTPENISSSVSQLQKDNQNNLQLTAGSQNTSAVQYIPPFEFDVLATSILLDGRVVLEVPLQYSDNALINKLGDKVVGLNDRKNNNPTQITQIVFYNPTTQSFTMPTTDAQHLQEIKWKDKIYWLYLQNSLIYISDIDFANARQVDLGFQFNGSDTDATSSTPVYDIKIATTNPPVFWLKTLSGTTTDQFSDFNLVQFSLDAYLNSQQSTLAVIKLGQLNQMIIDIDQSTRASTSLASSIVNQISVTTGQNIGGDEPTTDTFLDLKYDYYPLANGKIFIHSSYYSDNYWLLDVQASSVVLPQQIPNIQEQNPGGILSTCFSLNNLCVSFNPVSNQLTKFDLSNSEVKVATGQPNLQGVFIKPQDVAVALTTTGLNSDQLLRYDPITSELKVWNVGMWVSLSKS